MGPEGGRRGGKVVGEGTPEHIASLDSPTGLVLRDLVTAKSRSRRTKK